MCLEDTNVTNKRFDDVPRVNASFVIKAGETVKTYKESAWV